MRKGIPRAEIVNVYGACITTAAKNPDEAESLLRFLGSVGSQSSNVVALSRPQPHQGVDQGLYSPVQMRLIKSVNAADSLVPLFEFNTHPEMARDGLRAFSQFWADRSDVDMLLAELEETRTKLAKGGSHP